MSPLFRVLSSLRILALLAALVGVCATLPAWAEAPAATAAEASATSPQGKFVQTLGDKAVSILSNKALSPEEKNAQFRAMLRDAFDLNTIARFVLGRNAWQSATPQQQEEYMRLFEAMVVKTYSDRFALYTGEGFKVRSATPEGDLDTVVKSEITHPDGSPATSVMWRVRQKGDKMGVIDVVVEGVSMSVTQRQEYSAVIQRSGGNIEGLLSLMRERVQSAQETAK